MRVILNTYCLHWYSFNIFLYFLFRIFRQVPPFRGGAVSINSTFLQVEHVELKEFLEIVADIKEVKRPHSEL